MLSPEDRKIFSSEEDKDAVKELASKLRSAYGTPSRSSSNCVLGGKMFEFSKSIAVLKEATKNDRTRLSDRLLDYITSITSDGEGRSCLPTSHALSSTTENCDWLVLQLKNCYVTGQVWVIFKVIGILNHLLFYGSNQFVESMCKNNGKTMLDVTFFRRIHNVRQENPTGAPLPSSSTLQGILPQEDAAAKPSPLEFVRDYDVRAEGQIVTFLAYLQSLCDYRVQFPFVKLTDKDTIDSPEFKKAIEEAEDPIAAIIELAKATIELLKVVTTIAAASGDDFTGELYVIHEGEVRLFYKMLCCLQAFAANTLFSVNFKYISGLLDKLKTGATTATLAEAACGEFYKKIFGNVIRWYQLLLQFNRTGRILNHNVELYNSVNVNKGRVLQPFKCIPDSCELMIKSQVLKTIGSPVALDETAGSMFLHFKEASGNEDSPNEPYSQKSLSLLWEVQIQALTALFEGEPLPDIMRQLDATVESLYNIILSLKNYVRLNFIDDAVEGGSPPMSSSENTTRRCLPENTEPEAHQFADIVDESNSSIEALLQEEDVVVVCNSDFSCTDRLRLVDRFQVLRESRLGGGSYGCVFRAWDELLGCYLAAKEVTLDTSKEHALALREVLKEYTVLTRMEHPNIVRVIAFMVSGNVGTIFMEWLPSGSLQDVLRDNPRHRVREGVVARYLYGALCGLDYLHSRGVLHRDVKPGNMLLTTEGHVKLTDFGTSFVLADGVKTVESTAITGTAPYIAPEAVQGTYSTASDVWSLGCTVVELLSGVLPWTDADGQRPETIPLLFRIGSLREEDKADRPHRLVWDRIVANNGGSVSPELEDLLDSMFTIDRHLRPTVAQLLEHPFVRKYEEEIMQEDA